MGELVVSRGAMLTLVAMLDLSDAALARIWWSRAKLAEQRGVAPCTITRHVNELEAAGAVAVDRAKAFEGPQGWTRWRTNRYRFCRLRAARQATTSPAGERQSPRPAPAPPAATQAPLFERVHAPPPVETAAPAHDEAPSDARASIARWVAGNRPSPHVLAQRARARAAIFDEP